MRKTLFLIALIIFSLQQCTSRNYIDAKTLQQITENKTFTFEAERVIPMNSDVMNAINNTSGFSSQLLNINGDGYGMTILRESLTLDLPYFGSSHSYIRNEDTGVDYTSHDFEIVKSTSKKGYYTLTITPNDISSVNIMYLDIYNNGSASLSIHFKNRQSISYNGFIKQNDKIKE